MAQLGVLTTELEGPDLGAVLDAVVGHRIGTVQFHVGSALPSVPLRSALELGLGAVGAHLSEELAGTVRREMERRALTMAAVDGTFNMVHPDRARREAGLGHLRRLIGLCPTLGTSVVTLCAGSRDEVMWRRHPENDRPEAWRDLIEVMAEAVACAEAGGVVLAIEPEVSTVVSSAEKARRLLDEVGSGALKVLMDPANLFGKGELPKMPDKLDQAFGLLGTDIGLAHAKDLDRDGEAGHLAAGHGRLDYGRYLALLEESGFRGAVVLHQLRGLDERGIDESFEHVRRSAPPGLFD